MCFSSRRRHTRYWRDWSSDVCSSDLLGLLLARNGLDVTLAEINPALNDYARWRFERRGLSARFLEVGAGEVAEAAFHLVSAGDALEQVPGPPSVLLVLGTALRPGGKPLIPLPIAADSSRPMHLWHDP